MIELGILFVLGSSIFKRARTHGRSGAAYLILLILLWHIGLIAGMGSYATLARGLGPGNDPALLLGLLLPLFGAALGAAVAFTLSGPQPQ